MGNNVVNVGEVVNRLGQGKIHEGAGSLEATIFCQQKFLS